MHISPQIAFSDIFNELKLIDFMLSYYLFMSVLFTLILQYFQVVCLPDGKYTLPTKVRVSILCKLLLSIWITLLSEVESSKDDFIVKVRK